MHPEGEVVHRQDESLALFGGPQGGKEVAQRARTALGSTARRSSLAALRLVRRLRDSGGLDFDLSVFGRFRLPAVRATAGQAALN